MKERTTPVVPSRSPARCDVGSARSTTVVPSHSSLAALSKLPFDVIKIDQQFVRQLERGDGQAAAIIEMILALARTLDMEVVAEGVERKQEVEFMAARGCEWVQGFLYGAAVPAAEFAEMLRRQAGEDVTAEDAA